MNDLTIENPYSVGNIEGFTPCISHLMTMMNYVRMTTIQSVEGLSVEQLDFQFSETSNSIGALLAHIAATEKWFQVYTFEDRKMSDEEKVDLIPALDLGMPGREKIKGNPLEYYIDELDKNRNYIFSEFKKRNDEWLLTDKEFPEGLKSNNYFNWFHAFEDEINHRGQMRLIRKMQKKI